MPIVADLLKSRIQTIGDLQKSLGDASPGADELDLVMQLDQCNDALKSAFEKYAKLHSRMVGALSPQAKAAADVTGIQLKKEIGVLEDCSIEIQKRLIGVRRSRSQATISKGFDDAKADLQTLREHVAAANRGEVRLDEATRRRLRLALSAAEMRVQESA